LGLGSSVKMATLARANIRRNCKLCEEFAYHLIDHARRVCACDDFEVKVDGNVSAFDFTTIDLCLSVFWWAEFRKKKGGIKMHTLYDVKTQIPGFIYITTASINDVNAMDNIPYEQGCYYILTVGTMTLNASIGYKRSTPILLSEQKIISDSIECTQIRLTKQQV
jgi:hypothetical protein